MKGGLVAPQEAPAAQKKAPAAQGPWAGSAGEQTVGGGGGDPPAGGLI